ncbi:MAG: hypothetical protein A3E82_02880 [Gammaproteobacteria bacterium RIFCSPHIGHO2_12_FULL_38_11]|nr:MAG: hypothetical protein A3E82_02880 [Gammaproteobacteria bacterium RIFCSPHIGHO2_12_FULL_38_11]
MSRRGGTRFDVGASNPDRDNTLLLELMTLEARRNFLAVHAKKLSIATTPLSTQSAATSSTPKKQQLENEISFLQDALTLHAKKNPDKEDYINGVLLPKFGTDADGISTRIAKHFAQLTDKAEPFVLLDTGGLKFYWADSEHAKKFVRFIKAHAVESVFHKEKLSDKVLPESMESLPKDQRYQGDDCTVVYMKHLQVEKVLELAQYHSYSLKPVASDWYAARELDRGQLITAEAVEKRHVFSQEKFPIRFVNATRIHLDDNEDLVKVTITADVEKSVAQPSHVVILFDDSASMRSDNKIKAANLALKNFVMKLSPDTLVSIQTFNTDLEHPNTTGTLSFRRKASKLQHEVRDLEGTGQNPAWCSIEAIGDTPLIEILANSAVFLRENASDLAITDDAIRNTTIALLTDGEATGPAKDAISLMQTTSGQYPGLLPAVNKVPGVTAENYMSYGLGGFSCRVLPVVFPIAIGTDSDAVFMQELAANLHMPNAFVSTNDAAMQGEINDAMRILLNMLVRVPQVFVGLGYQYNNARSAVGIEEHNVFNHRGRIVYFKIPREARELNLCTAIGESTQIVSDRDFPQLAITDKVKTAAITNEYVAERLMEIKMEYSNAMQVLAAGYTAPTGTRRRAEPVKRTIPADVEQKFAKLKAQMQAAARALLSAQCIDKTKCDIELFIDTLEKHTSIRLPVQSIAPDRKAAANYTQGRMIGEPVVLPVYTIAGSVFESIQNSKFDTAKQKLAGDPLLINSISDDRFKSTPLISAIVKLESSSAGRVEIENFITFLLQQPSLDLTKQDATGNTALHRAAWYGLFDICKKMIQTAKDSDYLNDLKRKTNSASAGATAGETVLDNIRRSPKLKIGNDEKQELQRLCADELTVDYYIANGARELNSHFGQYWNTPIMQLLRDLRDSNPTNALTLRTQILLLLDTPEVNLLEGNFDGDTALHYAIWYGEFDIAKKIIDKTPTADKALLFAARNSVGLSATSGGEVPHMNLALSGKRAFLNFEFDPILENATQLHRWLELCEIVGNHVDKKQLAELSHLMQMYGKELQGYDTTTFLQAAPIVAFNDLLKHCESIKLQHPKDASEINGILQKLNEVKADFSEKTAEKVIEFFRIKIDSVRQFLSTEGCAASPIVPLCMLASEKLTRLKDYVNAKSATLAPMVSAAAVASVTPPSGLATKVSMFVAVENINNPSLNALIRKVATYKDDSKKSQGKRDGATELYGKLTGFKARTTYAAELAKYLFGKLNSKEKADVEMLAGRFSHELKDYFIEARDLINQIACEVCRVIIEGVDVGAFYADAIERIDSGYKIHGRNNRDNHRVVIMHDDGRVVGFNGFPPQSDRDFAECKLYENREKIFAHFGIDLPENHAVPAPAAAVPGKQ